MAWSIAFARRVDAIARTEPGRSHPGRLHAVPRLGRTIPALPVSDVMKAVSYYEERFGFEPLHQDSGFAVIERDDARIHLWQADDEGWQKRPDQPVRSGAESFLAGTASCRIEVDAVDALFEELRDVLHPASRAGVKDTDFGTREFATLDLDGNLIEFFLWR